ncbi:hypothetical protein BH10PSE17_BH10PSE17_18190 [soil metagenome]
MRVLVWAALILLSVAWALHLGRIVNWDQFNYHFYSGTFAFDTRLDKDFLAATSMGYLNRLGFVPFAFVATHFPSGYAVALLAAMHAMLLCVTFEIALLLPYPEGTSRRWMPVAGAVLAILSPFYLVMLGSSSNDFVAAIPVLAGWWCLLSARVRRVRWLWLSGGICLGAAVGFKLTSLVFLCGSFPLIVSRPSEWRSMLTRAGLVGAGVLVGFLIVDGWWAWQLWQSYGNPVFPLFNRFFESPMFPLSDFGSQRFTLHSAWAIAKQPFAIALPQTDIYAEAGLPDIRFAVLFVVGAVACAWLAARRTTIDIDERRRSLLLMMAVFVLSWLVWQVVTGAGRYMFPLGMIAGPLLVACLTAGWMRVRMAVVALVTIFVAQAFVFASGSVFEQFNAVERSQPWYSTRVPEVLARKPHLVISTSIQSFSAIVPYLHPDSEVFGVGGVSVMPEVGPAADRLKASLERFGDSVVALVPTPVDGLSTDAKLARFGLKVKDVSSCMPIETPDYWKTFTSVQEGKVLSTTLSGCFLERVAIPADYKARHDRAQHVVEAVIKACPDKFRETNVGLDGNEDAWLAYFIDTDVIILMQRENVYMWTIYTKYPKRIGTAQAWLDGAGIVECGQFPIKRPPVMTQQQIDEVFGPMGMPTH